MLSYRKSAQQPNISSYPYVWVRITDEFKSLQFTSYGAIIDSGADYTCIPHLIVQGTSYDYEWDVGTDFNGKPVQVKLVRILKAAVELLDDNGTLLIQKTIQGLRLPIVNGEGLLGRDILNDITCILDGPHQVCSLK